MASLRVGIVGVPAQISILVPILQSLKVRVTAIWCKCARTRRTLSEKFSLPFLSAGFQELLICSEVDLVYVATEPSLQAELAVKALTSGKHCICQKPPCINRKEAEKMVSLSRYYNQLVCLLESHLRFLPSIKRMKELVKSGYVGKPLFVDARVHMSSLIQNDSFSWMCDSAMGGGILNLVGSQIIDLVSYVTGERAQTVHGSTKTFTPHTDNIHGYRTITSDDYCVFQMQCSKGVSVCVYLHSHLTGQYKFEFSVTGAKNTLTVRGLHLYENKEGSGESIVLQQEDVDFRFSSEDLSTSFPTDFYVPTVIGCKELFSTLSVESKSSGSQPLTPSATFEDGLYIRTVLDAIHSSSETGEWVEIHSKEFDESRNPFWENSSVHVEPSDSPKLMRPV